MASSPDKSGFSEAPGRAFTTHDPACDQCRIKKLRCDRELPICSNCAKAKVDCLRSNRGKRTNQTTRLVTDFETFGAQLGELERNVNRINDQLSLFFQNIPREGVQIPSSEGGAGHGIDGLALHRRQRSGLGPPYAPADSSVILQEASQGSENLGSNRPYETTSLMSLFEEADERINKNLDDMRPKISLRDILHGNRQPDTPPAPPLDSFLTFKSDVYRRLPLFSPNMVPDLAADEGQMLLPPKKLLDPIVEPYFRHISPVVPLIGRLACLEAIERTYSPTAAAESIPPSIVVLFNYMILFCFGGRYMPLERPSSDIDIPSLSQFEKPFVANLRKAPSSMGKLIAPNLLNVQALLALTLISQKYFSEDATSYFINQACFVAKSMNLHRRTYETEENPVAELDERRLVFWNLFTVDKDISLLMGTPPNLPHDDCDVPLPLQASFDFLRRIDSAIILGKVYNLLYSPASRRSPQEIVEKYVDRLLGEIDGFQKLVDNASSHEINVAQKAWQYLVLEHKHTAHHSRLMVLRRSASESKVNRRAMEARQCIKMISKIHIARTTVGGFMVLRRPFQWRPFAAFFELLPRVFTFPVTSQSQDDLKLVKELVDIIRVVASTDQPASYCGRLLQIASGCAQVCEEFSNVCHHHRATLDSSQMRSVHISQRKRKAVRELHPERAPRGRDLHEETGYNDNEAAMPFPSSDYENSLDLTRNIMPADPGFQTMLYSDLGPNGMLEMVPGWPSPNSSNFPLLDDDFFWGQDTL